MSRPDRNFTGNVNLARISRTAPLPRAWTVCNADRVRLPLSTAVEFAVPPNSRPNPQPGPRQLRSSGQGPTLTRPNQPQHRIGRGKRYKTIQISGTRVTVLSSAKAQRPQNLRHRLFHAAVLTATVAAIAASTSYLIILVVSKENDKAVRRQANVIHQQQLTIARMEASLDFLASELSHYKQRGNECMNTLNEILSEMSTAKTAFLHRFMARARNTGWFDWMLNGLFEPHTPFT
jgi:hypothetical protein